MTIQERIDTIEDWIGGNIRFSAAHGGEYVDHMALTRLLRQHLEGAFYDGESKGIEESEKDFQLRINHL